MEHGRGFIGVYWDSIGFSWDLLGVSRRKCIQKHTQAHRPSAQIDMSTLSPLAATPWIFILILNRSGVYAKDILYTPLTLVFPSLQLLLVATCCGAVCMAVPSKRTRDGLLPGLVYCGFIPPRQSGSALISLGTSEDRLYIHVLSLIQYSMQCGLHSSIRLYISTLPTVKCCAGYNDGANNCGELSKYRTILRK